MYLTAGLFFFSAGAFIMVIVLTYEVTMANEIESTTPDKTDNLDATEIELVNKFNEIARTPQLFFSADTSSERAKKIAQHKVWLSSIRHEFPSPATHFKVGVYIRYFNQTKYDDYLETHKAMFMDAISLCPNWEFVGYYIDEGSTAPNMETAAEWSRLLNDATEGKVDLIITQKVSNVSKKVHEVTLCARLLAAMEHPVGIYFLSEDIYTLASYYQHDLRDTFFLPNNDTEALPKGTDKKGLLK